MNGGQQKIKIVRTNRQSNLRGSCQSVFSLCWHHPSVYHRRKGWWMWKGGSGL